MRLQALQEFLRLRRKENLSEWLENNIEETLGVYELPIGHRKKMRPTNMLERFNQELKRRSRVVRIFSNEQSCLRLLGSLCQEMTEEWSSRKYIDMEAEQG